MQTDGDLLAQEFDDVWARAPKFPVDGASEERIDVDSFVQIYRDIDDLFEDEEEPASMVPVVNEQKDTDKQEDAAMEAELEAIFETICDKDKLLSFDSLSEWDEVQKLLEDGLLGVDELENLWIRTKKAPGSEDRLDVDGFLSFNIELDSLFEFEDEEMDEIVGTEPDKSTETSLGDTTALVEGDQLPLPALFSALKGPDGNVGKSDLDNWSELREMLTSGELLQSELEALFAKAGGGKSSLNEEEFGVLFQAIDDLFEDEEPEISLKTDEPFRSEAILLKEELFDTLKRLEDPDLLPCGLDFDEKEQKEILSIVSDLERQPTNLIRRKASDIEIEDVAGTWDLIYSSSSAMKFNKGLSGLGGTFPRGRFAGLKQTLKASKYLTDVEYTERIEVNPSSASFDVKVTGNWDLQNSVSLFTGEPSVVLTIVPDMISYGITSMRADHWKSIGPTNMLDITYLDEDLRIMRGNTAVENIFIYQRSKQ